MNGLNFGQTFLVYNRYACEVRVEAEMPEDPVFFILGSAEPSTFHLRKRTTAAASTEPLLVMDSPRMTIERPEASRLLVLRVWLKDLEQHWENLTGRHYRGRLRFDQEVDLSKSTGASLKRLILFLVSELDYESSLATSPQFRQSWNEILLNGLLSLPHNWHHQPSKGRCHEISPGLVNRAQEYMRANLGEPVTISDLLCLCQCSRRTLFAVFRNAKGYSPMDFLTEQRLLATREKLLNPSKAVSVSETALQCGFVHLGRFAATYRRRFGESPSETLRQSGQRLA